MLKGIPNILSPELLKILMEMGHGDEITIANGNFPAASHAQKLVRYDGHGTLPLIGAILRLLPLDTFVKHPAVLMAIASSDQYTPDVWPDYKEVVQKYNPHFSEFERMERPAFYECAQKAYAIVATGNGTLPKHYSEERTRILNL